MKYKCINCYNKTNFKAVLYVLEKKTNIVLCERCYNLVIKGSIYEDLCWVIVTDVCDNK